MKRLLLVSVVALAATTALAAPPSKNKTAQEVPVAKTAGAERVSPPKQKKQADPDGPPVQKHPGPVPVGPPAELRATKASGKKFDLRTLPFVPPAKRERPEREAPQVHPVGMESAPPSLTSAAAFVPQTNA